MHIAKAIRTGFGQVLAAPSVILWIFLASVVIAAPFAAAMRGILKEAIGSSLVHENLRIGFDLDWYAEFSARSSGLGHTFGPDVIGFLPTLRNGEKLLDGAILKVDGTVLAAGSMFLLAWCFFAGGAIWRYAKPDDLQTRTSFFAACAQHFFRFVRLLVISLICYGLIFRLVAQPLHSWLERSTKDVTVERSVMLDTLAAYLLTALLLMLASVMLDYAKIAMVMEERHSALIACIRALRFVAAHPWKTAGVYLALVVINLVLLSSYAAIAPGSGQLTNYRMICAFLAGELFLLARLMMKLWFLASQTDLFQSS